MSAPDLPDLVGEADRMLAAYGETTPTRELVRRLRDAYVEEFIAEDRAQQRLERALADKDALVQALDGKVTTVIDRERDEIRSRADRLAATVRKLAGWAGHDIADLIDEGYLQDGDLG